MTPKKIKAGGSTLPPNRAGCALWWSASLIEADPLELRAAIALHADRYTALVRDPVGPHAAMRRALHGPVASSAAITSTSPKALNSLTPLVNVQKSGIGRLLFWDLSSQAMWKRGFFAMNLAE